MSKLVQGSHVLALRTCIEIEGDYVKRYLKITGKPVFPVGCLPSENKIDAKTLIMKKEEKPWGKIFEWLDKQEANSVVFVGFRSEYKLRRDEIHEIAHGVELSGLPFLFSLWKPDWAAGEAPDQILPPRFAARTAAQWVVQVGWAPQRELLGHRLIGASFFHAGWGSIVEAMQFGHVLVFLPFIIDQPLNARMMVEKGLGIEVDRAKDGTFHRDDVAAALKKAIVSGDVAQSSH